ncbi:hypothetical protein, partial [Enterococcus entomosocium]|uniref:hypothetical protein n=1 Tax=Enterococcus entomosocium TaxID=3034352 RepID=UPI00264941E2
MQPEWLLYGKDKKSSSEAVQRTVPLVGYVGAGATAFFFGEQGHYDDVPAPDGASTNTVAVEIRGDSLGA